jgi:hemerythrin-like domain-containing protein
MLVRIGSRSGSSEDLVDLLLACHDRIRSFTALARAAAERSDAGADDVIDACSRVERYFVEALPLHVRDEEESVLPRLEGRSAEVDGALRLMKEQHERHQPMLRDLLDVLSALRRDPSAGALRSDVARAAGALERAFAEHLALEEAVVFPAIRVLLSPLEQTEIKDELRRRRDAK